MLIIWLELSQLQMTVRLFLEFAFLLAYACFQRCFRSSLCFFFPLPLSSHLLFALSVFVIHIYYLSSCMAFTSSGFSFHLCFYLTVSDLFHSTLLYLSDYSNSLFVYVILTLKVPDTANWCTATRWNKIMTAQCEGMGEVGSARYEPALLPPCPSIRVLSYSNCQRSIHSSSRAWQCKC